MANYYINYTPFTVGTSSVWGNDSDPLTMTMYAISGYYVNASMFTMKGYEPTSIGPEGERIWENNLTTTDASGNSVTVDLGDFNKVEMSNGISYDIVFPESSQASDNWFLSATVDYNYLYDVFGGNINGDSWYAIAFATDGSSLGENWYIDPILLDGVEIQDGDLIGVFSENNGQYTCCGLMAWDSSNSTQYLTVLGQNSSGIGMQLGETMHIFIKDVSTNTIYSATPTQQPDVMFGDFVFTAFPLWSEGFIEAGGTSWSFSSITTSTDITNPTAIVEGNFVNVKAWLNPEYTIGYQNIQFTLDIDGDGEWGGPTVPQQNPNEFNLTVQLGSGVNSNCDIITNLNYLNSPGIFDTNTSDPTWIAEAVDDGNETSATIKFTKNQFYGSEPANLNTSLPNEGGGNNSFNDMSFIIIPKQGYTVSRSNFWIETVGDWTSNASSNWNSDGTINSVGPTIDQPTYDTTGNIKIYNALNYTGTQSVEDDLTTYLAQEYGAISNGEEGCYNCWRVVDYVTNPKVGLEDSDGIDYYNLHDIQGAVPGGECVNYVSSGVCSAIKIWDGMWFPSCDFDDDSCNYGDWTNYQMLFNCNDYGTCNSIHPWTYENNPMNDNLNSSNYINNVVIITLRMLSNYNPQDNVQTSTGIPKNMVFTINGSAMELPIEPSVDTSFNITLTEFVPR